MERMLGSFVTATELLRSEYEYDIGPMEEQETAMRIDPDRVYHLRQTATHDIHAEL